MTSETAQSLDLLDARFLARLKPWQERVSARVTKSVEDAAAHAHRSITETLRRTPDGRPSAARLRRSPSYLAALDRLDGLLTTLAGPSVHSLKGMIRNARDGFYRDSFAYWLTVYDPELWVSSDPKPTKRGINAIRGALIQSADLRTTLAGPIEAAKRSLAPSVVSASNRESTRTQAKDSIDLWAAQSRSAILTASLRALSDADQRAHTLAALNTLAPKFLGKADLAASSHRS